MGDRNSGGLIPTLQLQLWRTGTGTAARRSDASDHKLVSAASDTRLYASGAVHPDASAAASSARLPATWLHTSTAFASHSARAHLWIGADPNAASTVTASNVNVASLVVALRHAL